MDNIVELQFDGGIYGYWQRVEIRGSIDDLCQSVQLAITRPSNDAAFKVTANTIAKLLINNVVIATVRFDSVQRNRTKDKDNISLVARSLARELIDCQYSKTLSGLKLSDIVKRLCAVFKVPVTIAAETAVVPHFSMQSEIPSNALINAARASNLLLYPLPDGSLILTGPTDSFPVATLTYGIDFESYDVVEEFKLRFSEYQVKTFDYASDTALQGSVKDTSLNFFRPMHIISDRHSQGLGSLERRATLERNRRMARAKRIEFDLTGFGYTKNGTWHPWQINTQVRIVIPHEDIDDIYLIGDYTFRQDDQSGSISHLSVMQRNAFMGEETKRSKRGSGVKRGKS